ncbi:MAG: nicotinamide-nucleotide amidohydrolase family protein [Chloroflexi bacterium]|nr:nicotinamide-nucleotide amidohydrolase family protein [Chloroflexota bacterium]
MQEVVRALAAHKLTVAIAEGDTGGLLLERLTASPGSSAVVIGGVVAYADSLKQSLLRVPDAVLREHGSVSAQAAEAMAVGMRLLAHTSLGVATTGIAGPGGATETKPVGLAYVAVASAERVVVREFHWQGGRAANRAASVGAAADLLRELLLEM